jgi:hypothetical protein
MHRKPPWHVAIAGGGRQKHWIKVKNRKHPAMDRVAESFRQEIGRYSFRQAVSASPPQSGHGTLAQCQRATFAGTVIQDSGKALPSGIVVGTSDTQTPTNQTTDTASNTFKLNGASAPRRKPRRAQCDDWR